jgi:hypothetical protein
LRFTSVEGWLPKGPAQDALKSNINANQACSHVKPGAKLMTDIKAMHTHTQKKIIDTDRRKPRTAAGPQTTKYQIFSFLSATRLFALNITFSLSLTHTVGVIGRVK